MALNYNQTHSAQSVIALRILKGKTTSVAIQRDMYPRMSIHCPDSEIIAQVSNVEAPDDADTDWYDIGTGKFVEITTPIRWLRVKSATQAKEDLIAYTIAANPWAQ